MRSSWMLLLLVVAAVLVLAGCAPMPSLGIPSTFGPNRSPEAGAASPESAVTTAPAAAAETTQPATAAPGVPGQQPTAAGGPTGVFTGTVTYRQRIALPADARATVRLTDVSPDAAVVQPLAELTFTPNGRQVPLAFVLNYDPQAIDSQRSYAVQAAVAIGGAVRWASVEAYPVLTGGNPVNGTEIVLEQVDPTPVTPPPTGLEGRNWVLASYGAPGQETAVPQGVQVSAAFSKEAGQVAGKAGCNSYFAAFTTQGDALKISGVGSTKMMCRPEQMTVENAYLKALAAVDTYKIDGDTLHISYDGGKGVLIFALPK